MNNLHRLVAALMTLLMGALLVPNVAAAAPQIGQPAPDFTSTDSKGESVSLNQYRGKTVVLEWTNADCPYTRKHCSSGNMQGVQALAQKNGVVWLTVISSAPGKQGYVNGPAADALTTSRGAAPTAVLLDPSGTVGRLYGAKTTPHMFIIDPQGIVVYNGAIDDKRSANPEDVKIARNYVAAALDEMKAGKPVTTATTAPYGCSVHYR